MIDLHSIGCGQGRAVSCDPTAWPARYGHKQGNPSMDPMMSVKMNHIVNALRGIQAELKRHNDREEANTKGENSDNVSNEEWVDGIAR
ncbi:hypothetical protein [Croceicoccus sp. YJ47]|uniref:hypothetical protein n=1 Tax=Croceicoccus sp. YJ47 TaxID=2798724 RepID=UPI001923D37A|nr:hypothetical protein [Croceicoccus sp. YJ47]QQN74826.1 hypothetical protein JD971_03635 [Croceicoccus sp. YJ47]